MIDIAEEISFQPFTLITGSSQNYYPDLTAQTSKENIKREATFMSLSHSVKPEKGLDLVHTI